jgi:hypothetical protein
MRFMNTDPKPVKHVDKQGRCNHTLFVKFMGRTYNCRGTPPVYCMLIVMILIAELSNLFIHIRI